MDNLFQHLEANLAFVREVSTPCAALGAQYQKISGLRYKAHLTGPDPELANVTEEVGVLDQNTIAILLQPVTKALRDMRHNGRFQLIGVPLPGDVMCIAANVYGGTNAHHAVTAAARSNDLLDFIWQEFAARPPGPRMILGDLNGDSDDFPVLQAVINDGSLIDLGLHTGFDAPTAQPTCFPFNKWALSRRDYLLVSADLLLFVNHFQVLAPDSDSVIPVHACLKIDISFPMHAPTQTVLRMPPSLYDPFLEILSHIHGVDSANS